ncbi:MAG: rod shape-determining protein RodA [Alphaproteobacteria bacterium]|jgi:rod shape determining protein RodA|nr:rod shape-determining protein RodA [Alphaproteobacteria bacterium]MDP6238978.1 rod shape-determining protein RodA [Alphaproteobacteria bacterium]MDP7173300.1 rod shape-determining protein RodA [Alphaproteobacteria bacterium]MDP7234018.1 rod shape-determining protein RodA [Alphaproteobacteria bacterium]MDP7487908.1 rod shape-determining protein RodA [Alphaproteobacteria bacterium]|tara:strand:+ start:437 stop:1597 length:1161 start_codon:yes stop_codon:yes gene_type:complete
MALAGDGGGGGLKTPQTSLASRLLGLNWALVLLVTMLAAIGFAMLVSAANGSFEPWAWRQAVRFAVGLCVAIVVALIDLRFWLRWAYLFYGGALLLLLAVEIIGTTGMGAQRWIDFELFNLQPSEVMKVALVLALARYFHSRRPEEMRRPMVLAMPLALIGLPAGLVLQQPDLGTAIMLLLAAGTLLVLAGVHWWMLGALVALTAAAAPIAWQFLHDYQRRRLLIFLDPENDPLGAGYHILQSKIALGSGGLFGKGYLAGTQSHLSFLPERHTDFIFTMLAEETGLVGGAVLLLLYGIVFVYGVAIALGSQNQFGRLLAYGMTTTMFLYVFINVAMVTGLVPVVGVPLPLISFGGTATVTVMVAIGLILCVHANRDLAIGRHGEEG